MKTIVVDELVGWTWAGEYMDHTLRVWERVRVTCELCGTTWEAFGHDGSIHRLLGDVCAHACHIPVDPNSDSP